jgi:hypothetical protein
MHTRHQTDAAHGRRNQSSCSFHQAPAPTPGCADSYALSGPIQDSLNTEDYGTRRTTGIPYECAALPRCAFAKAVRHDNAPAVRQLLTGL